jgi:AraC family transcriptional regulator
VHPVHLAREFRRFHRCTPGEMLRAHRIRRAASLLRAPRARIAEVAAATGFADQAQFTKCFKRETGMTPGQYRVVFGSERAVDR